MKNSATIGVKIRTAFSGGLLGVVLLILLPGNVFAQADSLVIDTTLTGVNLSATAWGDYDNDGDLDLVLTGTTNGGSSGAIADLYDNDGSGNFTKNTTVSSNLTGAYRSGAAFGDYDNDGFLDLIIVGYNTSNVGTTTLYKNNGNGTFSTVSGTGFLGAGWASASWGDYNNDGFLDLFIGGLPGSGTRFNIIYENDGDGTFTNANAGFLGSAGGDFVHADYDNDGDLDVALAGYTNAGSAQSKFYRNDNGTFTEVSAISSLLLANDNATMVWGDFDNDGDLDLFNAGGGNAKILLNDGSGGLSNSGQSFTGVYQSAADWNDYDLDGDLDLVYTGNISGSKSYLYDNDGDGTFSLNTDFSLTIAEQGTVNWVDVDNDGDADLMLTGYLSSGSRTASLYKNNESTSNSAPTAPTNLTETKNLASLTLNWNASSDSEGGPISYSVYLVNDDSTGFLIPTESDTSNGFRRLTGLGNSGITNSQTYSLSKPLNGDYTWYVQAIDASGLVSGFSSSSFTETNTYSGPVVPSNVSTTLGDLEATISWDSVSNDYFTKFNIYLESDSTSTPSNLITSISDTSYQVTGLLYDTNYYFYITTVDTFGVESSMSARQDVFFEGSFSIQDDSTLTGVNLGSTAWGDYDNDGDLDVVVTGTTNGGNSGAIAELYDNDGSGNFTKNTSVSSELTGAYRSGAAFGDYDNDGYLDLAIMGYNTSGTPKTTLYNNDGSGSFSVVSGTGFTDAAWASASWADYNNDGNLDLLIGGIPSSGSRFNTIYKNNGDGTFTDANAGFLGTAGGDFVASDYDNDGDLDMAVAGFSGSGVQSKFYRNDDSTFTEITSISSLLFANDNATMEWGDFDNDGDLDLFNSGGGSAKILLNDGSGGLSNSGLSFNGVWNGSADWSDYDLDGDLDLIYSGNNSGSKMYLYENDGDGTFTLNTSFPVIGTTSSTVDFVDIDNDGDADAFSTGYDGSNYQALFYENKAENNSNINTAPSIPDSLNQTVNGNTVTLTWDPSTDTEGGPISYSVYLVNDDSTGYVLSAESDTTNGFRRVIGIGNSGITSSHTFEFMFPPNGDFSWYVQAIDAAGLTSDFVGSSFSATNSYAGPEVPVVLSAVQSELDITFTWESVPQQYFSTYKIYQESDSTATPSNLIASTTDTSYTASVLLYDTNYYFYISAVDSFNVESDPSLRQDVSILGNLTLQDDTTFTGVSLGATAWGDYDNDGDLDLVITGTTNGGNSGAISELYDNDGSGNFTKNSSVSSTLIGAFRSGAAFGDYDNDGYLDLVIIGYNNSGTGTTTLYNNNGDGSFSTVSNTGFNNGAWASASWADFNNDGAIDLFIGGVPPGGSRFNSIYLNDGDGTFMEANTPILGSAGGDFVHADYDNDGDIDVAISGFVDAGSTQSKFYKNENGILEEVSSISSLIFASDNAFLKWVDFDNDEDLDLFMTGNGSVKILENDGNGGLSNSGVSFTGVYQGAADFADYDFDGDMDLFYTGNISGSKSYFYENDGDGTFTQNNNYTFPKSEQGNVDWVDVDNDGAPELFISGLSEISTRFSVLYKNTTSSSNSAPGSPTNLTQAVKDGLATFSWDKSTDPEGSPISYQVFVYNQDSTKTVTPFHSDTTSGYRKIIGMGNSGIDTSFSMQLPSSTYRWGVQAIDGTGSASAFSASTDTIETIASPFNLAASLNDAAVELTWNIEDTSGVQYYTIFKAVANEAADSIGTSTDTSFTVNNLDRASTFYFYVSATSNNGLQSPGSKVVSVYIDPYYTEINSSQFSYLSYYATQDWADYDQDGDLDLFSANSNNEISVYDNNGAGGFSKNIYTSADFDKNLHRTSQSVIDYDNDGDLDVFRTGQTQHPDYVYISILFINDGSGNFTETILQIPGVEEGGHAWGDLNNDGFLDLFLTGDSGNDTPASKLYFSDRNGGFIEDTVNTFEALIYSDVAFGDYDNDGDLDIVISGESTSTNVSKLYKNNGNGVFQDSNITLPDVAYSRLDWGDYDSDGDLDLLIAGSSYVYLYDNDGIGGLSSSGFSFYMPFADIDFGDFDKDGDLDIVAMGANFNYPYTSSTKIYVNNTGSFSELLLNSVNYYLSLNGSIRFVDFDNDGDLDIYQMGYRKALYRNNVNTSGTTPSKPSNIQFSLTGDTLSVSWDPATDPNSSPISYEVSITRNNTSLRSPLHSDTTNGFRRINRVANAGPNTSLELYGQIAGNYKIGVQAINGAKNASQFETIEPKIGSYLIFSDSYFSSDKDSVFVFDSTRVTVVRQVEDSTATFSLNANVRGTFFIDSNNNNTVDTGEELEVGQNYLLSRIENDSLKYISDEYQFDQSPLDFSTADYIYPDGKMPSILSSDQSPSISGTADQGGWYLLSNSMNTTLGTFLENVWTQGAVNADTETGTPNLYFFNQDSAKYIAITSDLETMNVNAGTGILAYLFPDDNYNDAEAPVNGGWPKELSNFGNPFDNSVEIPVRNVDVDGSSTTTGSEGFALLGNPYPFTISLDSLVAELVDVDAFANRYVYLWDAINKRYELKLNGSIDPYTSFFVRTVQSGTSGNVNLQYSDYYAEVAPKIAPNVEFEFTLTHKETQRESNWVLKTTEEANSLIDPHDGYYLGSYASEFANLYTLIGDQPLSINNLPNQAEELFEVPLYLDASIAGNFDLSWNSNQLPEGWTIELVDLNSGTTIDIKDQYSYNFDHQLKAKASPKSPKDLYTFAFGKSKSVNQPQFMLKVNTGQAVSNEDDLGIPREVELYQNYPNPFNPTSIIRFGVPEQAPVRLEVFDILGRKVMSLLNGEVKKPGRYNIAFDGRALASGMYIYRLVIGNKVLTKKMTLIK